MADFGSECSLNDSRGRLLRVVESTVRRPNGWGSSRNVSIDPLVSGFLGSGGMAGSIARGGTALRVLMRDAKSNGRYNLRELTVCL